MKEDFKVRVILESLMKYMKKLLILQTIPQQLSLPPEVLCIVNTFVV